MKLPTNIVIGFIAALALAALNAAISNSALEKLGATHALVDQTQQSIRLLVDLRAAVADAEAGQRGFVATGEARFLDPYIRARALVAGRLKEIERPAAADAEESLRLAGLARLIEQRFGLLDGIIAARKEQGAEAALKLIESSQDLAVGDGIRRAIDDAQARQDILLSARAAESDYDASMATVTNAVAAFVNFCLLAGIFFLLMRDTAARRKAASAEHDFNDKLAVGLAEVRQRNEEITLLSQMSSFLQTCASSEEACAAIARFGPQLFPTESGVLYLFHASRNYVERVASWDHAGDSGRREQMFPPADCWALRRGRVHAVATEGGATMVCAHVARTSPAVRPCICAPMMAQGETLGLLYLQYGAVGAAAGPALSDAKQQLAAAVAEQIALALSNLNLRETLRQQSVRDPLTGLYNRRFLEEAMDREIARLERKSLPLSVIMIDVDHFKSFNDTFGHEAGDAVLRDLGGVLQRHVRGSDIACRYGGEEFTIILPEATLDIGRQRADILRAAARELRLVHDGKSLGALTLSLGVACMPEHGRRREHLLQAADVALYEAKARGRNCVVVSAAKTLKVVESLPQRDQGGR